METYPEQFPNESQPDPSRRAEDRVFDAIQGTDRPGFENHEGQPDPEAPEIDFTLRLPGVSDFRLEIKGVRQSPKKSKRDLETLDGPVEESSPLRLAWDAVMSLREDLVDIPGIPAA